MPKRKRYVLYIFGFPLCLTFFLPCGKLAIPVQGAATADWNHRTFWHKPWGRSGVHKGIDIFAAEGTPVIAAASGFVIYSGSVSLGGNVVAILGSQWMIHYYAHLAETGVSTRMFVQKGAPIGSVETTDNAVGKPPHLHYSIITTVPYIWRYSAEPHGFWRMWHLNPDKQLKAHRGQRFLHTKVQIPRNQVSNSKDPS